MNFKSANENNAGKILSETSAFLLMVSVLAASVADHGMEHRLGQSKGYKIGICC
jgi:hypothetical protein